MSKLMWKLLACMAVVGMAGVAAYAGEGDKGNRPEKPAGASAELTDAAAKAVKAEFPNAVIAGAKAGQRGATKLFHVQLTQADKKLWVGVSDTGVIVSVGAPVAAADLPKAVADAVKIAAPDATVKSATRGELRVDDKMNKLDKAKVHYEIRMAKADGTPGGMLVGEDGAVIKPLQWKEKKPGDEQKAK